MVAYRFAPTSLGITIPKGISGPRDRIRIEEEKNAPHIIGCSPLATRVTASEFSAIQIGLFATRRRAKSRSFSLPQSGYRRTKLPARLSTINLPFQYGSRQSSQLRGTRSRGTILVL